MSTVQNGSMSKYFLLSGMVWNFTSRPRAKRVASWS